MNTGSSKMTATERTATVPLGDPVVGVNAPAGRVIVRVRGLRKSFGGQEVLKGVDADLLEGEVVLLDGPNGAGKTTLLNILTGNIQPDAGRIELLTNGVREIFVFPRHWWQDLNPMDHFLPERVAREGVGRSWQDTRLFGSVKLGDNISVATPRHPGESLFNILFRPCRVSRAEAAANAGAAALLEALGIDSGVRSSADMISLGQTKRVAIARAVSAGGKILFLDEPLAGLDAAGIEAVLDLLRQLAREHRVTMVIIEHVWNARHILAFANRIWTLQDGKVITEAPNSRNATSGGPASMEVLVKGLALAEAHELPRGARLSIYRRPGVPPDKPVLEARDLVVRRGRRLVIGELSLDGAIRKGLNLLLRAGDLAILGAPNGWGKTTLFEALAGVLPVAHGSVHLLGKDMTTARPWDRSRVGLHLLRANNRVFSSLTVDETFALSDHGVLPASLSPLRSQHMQQLSGGEQQMVCLGQMAASRKRIYLLDEPFSALDGQRVGDMFGVIRELAHREKTAVLIAMPATGKISAAGIEAIEQQ